MQCRAWWLVAGLAGGALATLSSGGGLLALALALASGGALTMAETLLVAGVVTLGLGLGGCLAVQGWAGWQAQPSRPFSVSSVRWLWLALAVLFSLGVAVNSLPLAPALVLVPIHILAMVLPPLIVLGLVGQALCGAGGSWREVVAGMAGGGLFGLSGSLIAEGLFGLALVVLVAVSVLAIPGGAEEMSRLTRELQDATRLADPTKLLELLLSPVVAVVAVGVACVAVPLIEEAFKTLAAGVVGRWIRPQPARAFLWGVASGAGLAMAENLFNGALGGADGWALGGLARFGATLMHCFTGGLVGWGWGQFWRERDSMRLAGSYIAAVIVHGVWNGAALGIVLLGGAWLASRGESMWRVLAGLGVLALVAVLALVSVAFVVALPFAGRRLVRDAERLAGGAAAAEEVADPELSEASMA